MILSKQALIYLLLLLQGPFLLAQDAAAVFEKYQKALSKIQTISYTIHRADTFVTGDTREKRGVCLIQRVQEDSLLGYHFSGSAPDLQVSEWYTGEHYYSFNHKDKNYTIHRKPGRGVIGRIGGQMTATEFIKADTAFKDIQLVITPAYYELRLIFPDLPQYNVTNRVKVLHLDKKTFLPKKVINAQQSLDKRQVLTSSFSNIKVNDRGFAAAFDHKALLNSYVLQQSKANAPKNELAALPGKPAPLFSLESFSGDSIHLDQLKGRLVLLDFWEVWCGPCIESFPKVQQLHDTYGSKGLTVIGITNDKRNLSSNKLLAEKKKLPFPNLIGNSTLEKNYQIEAIPEYILIDQTGTIILAQAGFDGNIEKMIKEKLGL